MMQVPFQWGPECRPPTGDHQTHAFTTHETSRTHKLFHIRYEYAFTDPRNPRVIYIVMGVSGCGKSSVGRSLADALSLPFHDADDFHPPANKAKMQAGEPLTDADRAPWLANMTGHFPTWNAAGGAILACSALKHSYRDALRQGGPCLLIHLVGSRALIADRLADRKGHFFNPALLDSQFSTLEPPPAQPGDAALCISVDQPVPTLVAELCALLMPAHR